MVMSAGFRAVTAAMLLCSMPGTAGAADPTFRCGSKLITVGMTQGQVLAYCGEPTSRSVQVEDVRSGNQVVGRTDLHTWVYESYSATRVLKFDQFKLMSIE
jgi:hypothetical protein